MSALHATRQHFIQEITQQIPMGRLGLAVIDHDTLSHVLVNTHGQVAGFGPRLTLLDPAAVIQDADARVTILENLGLDDLATILDSFADPDSGTVVAPAALAIDNRRLPVYFHERLVEGPALVRAAQSVATG